MSQSTADESNRSDAEKYGTAWAAIMQLVRDGKSWSGREKNCCYLNTASSLDGATRFANISHVSGLDFADDSRAIAVVDWDHDGDLDLWFRNRTAPRLRFMANQLDARRRSYVALRLEGTSSNRDGVGAVVEVVPRRSRAPLDADAPRRRLVKSVRAGDLFLSQSSKWLQFGLDGADEIATVTVLWSGRDSGRETFTGVAPGGRYVLKQGSGAAAPWQPRSTRPTAASALETKATIAPPVLSTPRGRARVILPRRIPFPMPSYRDAAGGPKDASPIRGALLVLLWAADCPHCAVELKGLADAEESLRKAGVTVLALSVDALGAAGASRTNKARDLIARWRVPFAWGFVDAASLDAMRQFETALFDRTIAAAVPVAFLLDGEGRAVAIYRGPLASAELIKDTRLMISASDAELHQLAPPFAGSWFTRPVDEASMAEFMARQFEGRLPERALPYLHLAAERATNAKVQTRLRTELTGKCHALALEYQRRQEPEQAAFYYESALTQSPAAAEIHCDYASMLGAYGILEKAAEHFQRALSARPGFERARAGLELVQKLQRGERTRP